MWYCEKQENENVLNSYRKLCLYILLSFIDFIMSICLDVTNDKCDCSISSI